jgi:hypothetical protein
MICCPGWPTLNGFLGLGRHGWEIPERNVSKKNWKIMGKYRKNISDISDMEV